MLPALRADPLEGVPVPGRVAVLAEREARLGLDDGERGPELVGGVGGELELALPGELDRGADAATDDQGAGEHQEEQHDARRRPR